MLRNIAFILFADQPESCLETFMMDRTYMKYLTSTIDKCLIAYCVDLKQYLLPCVGCSKSIEIWHLQLLEYTYKLFREENFAFLTVNALSFVFS